jgi:APA family basic amino acid/polyamine antiporter
MDEPHQPSFFWPDEPTVPWEDRPVGRPGDSSLRRELGLAQVTASGVGIIIGAGIYALLGAATVEAGASVWASFAVAGFLSALTALSYCELASMFPAAGAEFDYARRVAPAWVAFLVGWVMIVGLIVGAGAVSLGFARYLRYFVDVPEQVAAMGLLLAVAAVALGGIRQSAALTLIFSVVQVGGLVFVAAIGVPHLGDHSLVDGISAGRVVGGAALVFFAFIGFDEVITLSDETRDPVRTVPRSLLLALGISTLLYMAVAVAGVSVLGADALASAEQPLAAVMGTALGDRSAGLVAVIALAATTNTTLLLITASSRLAFGMAERGALPPLIGRVSGRGVPWVGVAIAVAGAAGALLVGNLALVASVTDFAVYVVFVVVNLVVIVLRFRQPRRFRPFRVPFAVARVPVPTVAALLVVFVMLPSLDLAAILMGTALTAVGLVVHLAIVRWAPASTAPLRVAADDDGAMHRTRVSTDEAGSVLAALSVDLAAVTWDLEQFRLGMESELAHGRADPDTNVTDDDLVLTGKIALAHLVEIPDYYTRLAAMEAQAFEEQERDR